MDLLARREHSASELRRKLAQRGFEGDVVAEALESLAREGLQSDERMASALASSHASRGKGPARIRHDLGRRGVAEDLIEQALDEMAVDWLALAREVRRKRFGPESPAEFPERARQARFLQSRGFTADQVRAAIGD